MNKVLDSATFVILGCDYSKYENFIKEIQESKTILKLGSIKKIEYRSNIPLPENFPMPIAGFNIGPINLIYIVPEKKITMEVNNYSAEQKIMKELLIAVSNIRLQDITAIGINYLARLNTENKKLNILNSSIHKVISDWPENTGFEVSIPFLLKDFNCSSTLRINKHSGGYDLNKTFSDYHYDIVSNYHFKFDSDRANIINRVKELENIVIKIDALYEHFNDNCKKIIEL